MTEQMVLFPFEETSYQIVEKGLDVGFSLKGNSCKK